LKLLIMNRPSTKARQQPLFVACGMYAFTDDLRNAWQRLFEHFFNLANPAFEVDRVLKFDTGTGVLNHPSLWFGHTCGYPLMTQFLDTMTPLSVPIFDLPGCDHKSYSSLLIVPDNSEINSLENCRGLRAVINAGDSNSGMNVLRHAVAAYSRQGKFFGQIQTSGSHLQSLSAIASRGADIAAIDCVSFGLIQDSRPELVSRVKSIGFTEKTCGLPFVMPKINAAGNDAERINESLNRALSMLDSSHRNRLHLKAFESVELDDYQRILDLEKNAQIAGYPVLA